MIYPNQHIIFVLLLSTCTVMSGTVIAPAIPSMLAYFSAHPHAGFIISALIGFSAGATALAAIMAGKLCDTVGPERLMRISAWLYAFSGVVGFIATHLEVVVVSRIILGISVAGLVVGTTSWIGNINDISIQRKTTGLLGVSMEFSGVVYFVVAGLLAALHWRWVFLIYLAPLFFIFNLPKKQYLNAYNQQNATANTQAVSKAFSLTPAIIALLLINFVTMAGLNAYVTQVPLHLDSLAFNSQAIGWVLGVSSLAATLGSLSFIPFNRRFSLRINISLGAALGITGYILLARPNNITSILIALSVVGFSFGFLVPTLINAINQHYEQHTRGRAQAWLAIAGFSGQFASPWLISQAHLLSTFSTLFTHAEFLLIAALFTLTLLYFLYTLYLQSPFKGQP